MAENSDKSSIEPAGLAKRRLSGASVTSGPLLHIPLASNIRPELEIEANITLSPTSSKAAKAPVGNIRHVSQFLSLFFLIHCGQDCGYVLGISITSNVC